MLQFDYFEMYIDNACDFECREKVKVDELGMEIMAIALPAALALAADPITSLVDTAFVGHLGILVLILVYLRKLVSNVNNVCV